MKIEELHIGQRVRWNDPDEGMCSCDGTVVALREDGTVDLRKNDGGEVSGFAHEISPVEKKQRKGRKQKYTVSMKVDGRVNVIVEAHSFKEAFELAKKEEYDPTEVECIEYVPVNATDEKGIMEDYD